MQRPDILILNRRIDVCVTQALGAHTHLKLAEKKLPTSRNLEFATKKNN